MELTSLPKLASADVRLLWVNDWYDGPLEAVVEVSGDRCLMVLHDPTSLGAEGFYRWVVFKLTPEQLAEEERLHTLFAEHVGTHWCFHPETPHAKVAGEDADPEKFYGAYRMRPELDLRNNVAVGWLDEMPKR